MTGSNFVGDALLAVSGSGMKGLATKASLMCTIKMIISASMLPLQPGLDAC